MTPSQAEAWKLREEGLSQREIANRMGRSRGSIRGLLERAEAYQGADPGVQDALQQTGLSLATAKHGWRRVQDESGNWNSVFWKQEGPAAEDLARHLADAFSDVKPARPLKAPKATLGDFCTLYPLVDLHLGMYAWGEETSGQDYDVDIACEDMRHAFAKLDLMTPNSTEAILVLGGDTFHIDDGNNQTPQSKHALDVDSRYLRVLDAGVQIIAETIDRLLKKHQRVIVRVLRGNHDMHSHLVLTMALEQRYRSEARVTVEKAALDLFMYQHGNCLIAAHHGDRAPPQRLALYLSDVCPFWSATRHRYVFVGHLHHDHSKDIGGAIRWEQLRAFAPADAYAAGMGYSARRAMQALTFHKRDGLVLRALDPIER